MQKCLGVYIEENLIKYAKVSKDKDNMKIESFGIKFFQNLSEELEKIIEETYSFSTPISINLANEKYLYFDIFALLNKKDIERTVQVEFESYCEQNNFNVNVFETRHALMPSLEDKEKIRALDVCINKIELNRQLAPLEKHKVTKITPTAIAIANLANLNNRENQLIVNMEDNTSLTTIYDKKIYNVEFLNTGSKEVLNAINKIENSYTKAYDICKNTTIYTAEMEENVEEQPFLQNIMPTIYKIAQAVQERVSSSGKKIQTIYLTGTLAVVNNIDLYFQEFFPNIECKILKPSIVNEATTKINIKEYVEVNSAIALAMTGLNEGVQEFNFKKSNAIEKIASALSMDVSTNAKTGKKTKIKVDLKGKLSGQEIWLIRGIAAVLVLFMIFAIFSSILRTQMQNKEDEIKRLIARENGQISSVTGDAIALDSKSNKYKTLIANLTKLEEKISDKAARRNSIPNLLNQLMANIPNKVQLVQIENTKDRTIVINAQSYDYDQLGYFVAVLKTKKILKKVITSSTAKPSGMIYISIEGELP